MLPGGHSTQHSAYRRWPRWLRERLNRPAALAAALVLLATPVAAQAPTLPPEGAVVIAVAVSDGSALLPVSAGVVAGLSCAVVGP